MARPTKSKMERSKTESALNKALEDNGLKEKYLLDQVAEYMKYYDNLAELNESLEHGMDLDCLKEKRQVTKEMRSILSFLGLTAAGLTDGGGCSEDL